MVLLRLQQVTLASLILACKEPATSFSEIGREAFAGLGAAVGDIESCLRGAFSYDKINYLMLMMVDPDVHFHVLPRYDAERDYAGVRFVDATWPGPPDITAANPFPPEVKTKLIADLRARFG